MTAPATRVSDFHVCPVPSGPSGPHFGGPVDPPGSPDVITGSQPQARATDRATCNGPPDFIVTGAAMVLVNKLPAARMGEHTAHGGVLLGCEPTVLIGGPGAGSTLGNPNAGQNACTAAAAGRKGGSTQQSGQNCSLESPRQIINRVSPPGMSEQQMLDWAATPQAGLSPPTTSAFPAEQASILNKNGVPAHQQDGTTSNMAQAVAEGKGVTASLDAAAIWNDGTAPGAWHTVLVTGIEYDANGNPVTVICNDTGVPPPGNCSARYPVADFQKAMNAKKYPGGNLVVTDKPIW